ncbi:hydroxymethylbilane synthase [Humidisolicoccus flavus]|uniref:hydroxymethylbilane synthase n=1 Tax=Humidisolicoccus flavus TaxID=3111414 RepID=UPI003251258D
MTLKVGTRGSKLAVTQTGHVVAKMRGETEIVTITTQGDTDRSSLASIGGAGVFVSALREALLAGEVDVIVHSLKDLPTADFEGIELVAVTKREDARDVLCARDGLTSNALPEGAKVGTGSPRRAAQLREQVPQVEVVDIRGNIETRLARVFGEDADLDAVVLAAAGLSRLENTGHMSEHFELSRVPTAPGQGALAIEVRSGDEAAKKAVRALDHAITRAAVTAERRVLAGLEAGCSAPLGATAIVDDGMLFLTATAYALDGSHSVTASHAATLDDLSPASLQEAAIDVADRAVAELFEGGAKELITEAAR